MNFSKFLFKIATEIEKGLILPSDLMKLVNKISKTIEQWYRKIQEARKKLDLHEIKLIFTDIEQLLEKNLEDTKKLEQLALDFESQTQGIFKSRVVSNLEPTFIQCLKLAKLITEGDLYSEYDLEIAFQNLELRTIDLHAALINMREEISKTHHQLLQGLN